MKRLSITIIVLFVSPTWALTFMGPPTSDIKKGELLLGFDYSNSKTDVEWSGYGYKGTLEDVESDLFLGKVGLGLSDRFELFGRFGVSEIDDTGNEFAWGVGTKVTLGHKDAFSWGALFQITALSAEETENIAGYLLNGDYDIYEYQVAIGPTYDMNGFSVYGGPFFHFIDGDVDLDFLGYTESYDIEQKSEFGGYIGLSWNIAETTNLSIEYQTTGDADAIGISLIHRFGKTSTQKKRPLIEIVPKVQTNNSSRKIIGWHVDTSRKDADGKFIRTPVYKDD